MVYTPAFGGSVPIKIDGTAATVAGGVITDVRAVAAGETVAIPANGYVMVFGNDFTSTSWYREPAVGTSVTLTPGLTDSDTSGFPMEEITAMVSGGLASWRTASWSSSPPAPLPFSSFGS